MDYNLHAVRDKDEPGEPVLMTRSAVYPGAKQKPWQPSVPSRTQQEQGNKSALAQSDKAERSIQVLKHRWMSLWDDIEDKLRNNSGPLGVLPLLDFNELIGDDPRPGQPRRNSQQDNIMWGSNGQPLSSIKKITLPANGEPSGEPNFLDSDTRKGTDRFSPILKSQKRLVSVSALKTVISEIDRITETRVDWMAEPITSTIEGFRKTFDSVPEYLPPGGLTKVKDYHKLDLVNWLREISYLALDWRLYVEDTDVKAFYSKILNTAVVRCSMLTTSEPQIYKSAKVAGYYREPSSGVPDEILVLDPKGTSLNMFVLLDVLIRIVLRFLGRPSSPGEAVFQFMRAAVITLCRDIVTHVTKVECPSIFLKVDEISTTRVQPPTFEWNYQAIGRYTDSELEYRRKQLQAREKMETYALQQGQELPDEDEEIQRKDEDNAQNVAGTQNYRDLIIEILNHSRQWVRIDAGPDPTVLSGLVPIMTDPTSMRKMPGTISRKGISISILPAEPSPISPRIPELTGPPVSILKKQTSVISDALSPNKLSVGSKEVSGKPSKLSEEPLPKIASQQSINNSEPAKFGALAQDSQQLSDEPNQDESARDSGLQDDNEPPQQ